MPARSWSSRPATRARPSRPCRPVRRHPAADGQAIAVGAVDAAGAARELQQCGRAAPASSFLVAPGVGILAPAVGGRRGAGQRHLVRGAARQRRCRAGARCGAVPQRRPRWSSCCSRARPTSAIQAPIRSTAGASSTWLPRSARRARSACRWAPRSTAPTPRWRAPRCSLGPAFGAGPELGRAIFLDGYGRPYWLDLDDRVRAPAPGLGSAALVRAGRRPAAHAGAAARAGPRARPDGRGPRRRRGRPASPGRRRAPGEAFELELMLGARRQRGLGPAGAEPRLRPAASLRPAEPRSGGRRRADQPGRVRLALSGAGRSGRRPGPGAAGSAGAPRSGSASCAPRRAGRSRSIGRSKALVIGELVQSFGARDGAQPAVRHGRGAAEPARQPQRRRPRPAGRARPRPSPGVTARWALGPRLALFGQGSVGLTEPGGGGHGLLEDVSSLRSTSFAAGLSGRELLDRGRPADAGGRPAAAGRGRPGDPRSAGRAELRGADPAPERAGRSGAGRPRARSRARLSAGARRPARAELQLADPARTRSPPGRRSRPRRRGPAADALLTPDAVPHRWARGAHRSRRRAHPRRPPAPRRSARAAASRRSKVKLPSGRRQAIAWVTILVGEWSRYIRQPSASAPIGT